MRSWSFHKAGAGPDCVGYAEPALASLVPRARGD